MKFYHGSSAEISQLQNHILSRYGFTAIFATPSRELAIKYAFSAYEKTGTGYLYSFDIEKTIQKIDFEGRISHSSVFRALILNLHKENKESVIIENVIDYPNEKLAVYKLNSILVLFDFELISNFKMMGKY